MEETEETRAQQWHDIQHGSGPPAYSDCWCCCTSCDPDYEEPQPNPYFMAAQAARRAT